MIGRDEMTIDSLLSDPLVGAVMQADGVTNEALRAILSEASAKLRTKRERIAARTGMIFANPVPLLPPPLAWRAERDARPLVPAAIAREVGGSCQSANCW
jgi:hypothetical protein